MRLSLQLNVSNLDWLRDTNLQNRAVGRVGMYFLKPTEIAGLGGKLANCWGLLVRGDIGLGASDT